MRTFHRYIEADSGVPTDCPGCHVAVTQNLTSSCLTCGKGICVHCGTLLSVHGVDGSESDYRPTRTYDSEVSRTGCCSPACAEEPFKDALASCLLDDLRSGLRSAGIGADQSQGMYGPSFELNLPGLPPELAQRMTRYCGTTGALRMPFRYLAEALLDAPERLETGADGATAVYLDEFEKTSYVLIAGQPFVLDTARKASDKGPSSLWKSLWDQSLRGVAQVLSTSGRHEEAAKTYELGGFFPEAGVERAKGKAPGLVGLDLAGLFREFQKSGMVTAFRCPSCGAGIRLGQDSSETKLHICPYCGTAIKESDAADFLSAVLSSSQST